MDSCTNCKSIYYTQQIALGGIIKECDSCHTKWWDHNEQSYSNDIIDAFVQLNKSPIYEGAPVATMITGGTKHDQGKPDLTLIRREAIEAIADVFTFGARKYGRFNYLQGMSHNRLLAAAARHLYAYIGGEDLDPESGHSHLAHLGCCVHMMLTYKSLNLGTDDRGPALDNSKKE